MRSRHSWAVVRRLGKELSVGLAVAGGAFGIGAEVLAGAPQGRALAFLDLTVGMLLLGFGAAAHLRRPASRAGLWLTLTGLAWFAGTLGWPFIDLHRGFLTLLLLSYPSGRLPESWVARSVVAVAMLDSTILPLARNDRLTVAFGVIIVAAAVHSFSAGAGIARRAAAPALLAALAFASVLLLGACLRLAGVASGRPVLWAYDLVIGGLTTVLFVDLLRARWSETVIQNLIVDLSTLAGSSTLRSRLARALGDPALVVGVWDGERRAYLDELGAPVELNADRSGRVATRIDDDATPLAVLIHDEATIATELVAPVAAVARTAVANASLELRIEEQTRAIAASRRRLVEAADGERRALQQSLAKGPEQRLRRASRLLAKRTATDVGVGEPGLQDLVEEAIAELNELANGVRPAELRGGLIAALPALAERSPLDVSALVAVGRLPDAVEAAAYFVCSEALTNVSKHARAASAHLDAVIDTGRLQLTISDDGVGGADANGAGLRGLTDRVEALGGRLRVESPPGAGTLVLAEIPCNSL
jgi:signal transduction histidine kinase